MTSLSKALAALDYWRAAAYENAANAGNPATREQWHAIQVDLDGAAALVRIAVRNLDTIT